jgi:hypothetical protein
MSLKLVYFRPVAFLVLFRDSYVQNHFCSAWAASFNSYPDPPSPDLRVGKDKKRTDRYQLVDSEYV